MTETIETGLVYIHRVSPTKKFIGCGALIEGRYVATCRHVWRDATSGGKETEVESSIPGRAKTGHHPQHRPIAGFCESPDGNHCDLVLLEPESIPLDVMVLQLARHDRFEVGPGFAHARLSRADPAQREVWRDLFPKGEIDPNKTARGCANSLAAVRGDGGSRRDRAERRFSSTMLSNWPAFSAFPS